MAYCHLCQEVSDYCYRNINNLLFAFCFYITKSTLLQHQLIEGKNVLVIKLSAYNYHHIKIFTSGYRIVSETKATEDHRKALALPFSLYLFNLNKQTL